jgi:amino acid efflux transporter
MAPAIAYIGAAARLACSLATGGFAPPQMARRSEKYHTPLGGLIFLSVCFAILLFVFSTRIVSLSTLIQVPSGTFILTYIGGCAAGIVLMRNSRWGVLVSSISLILTGTLFLFAGWAILYAIAITVIWSLFMVITGRFRGIFSRSPS